MRRVLILLVVLALSTSVVAASGEAAYPFAGAFGGGNYGASCLCYSPSSGGQGKWCLGELLVNNYRTEYAWVAIVGEWGSWQSSAQSYSSGTVLRGQCSVFDNQQVWNLAADYQNYTVP